MVLGYGALPPWLQRYAVRRLAPAHVVGAVAVLRRPDGRVLLVDAPYVTGWGLPGGDLKRREAPHAGLARELREELGLVLDVPVLSRAVHRSADRWVVFVHAAELDEATAESVRVCSPELRGVGWFDPGSWPPLDPDAVEALALVLPGS